MWGRQISQVNAFKELTIIYNLREKVRFSNDSDLKVDEKYVVVFWYLLLRVKMS